MNTQKLLTITFIIVMIIYTSCDKNAGNKADDQTRDFLLSDSLWTPTGDAKLDSLLQLAAITPQDTNLVKIYFDIGYEYFFCHGDTEKAKEFYEKIKELSEKLDWNEGRYLFALGYPNILVTFGLVDSAIVIFEQTLEIAKSEMNQYLIATFSTNLGVCYFHKSWYETALEYYHQAINMFEKQGNKHRIAALYNLIGAVYCDMSLIDEHIKYTEISLEMINDTPDTLDRANWLNNYSVSLLSKNELEKAENALLEAQRISLLNNETFFLGRNYLNLAELELRKHNLEKLELYLGKAKDIFLQMGDVRVLSALNVGYAQLEMYRGRFNQSEKYIREALDMAIEYDLSDDEMACYKLLANLAVTRNDFRDHRLYEDKVDSTRIAMVSEKSRQYAKEMAAKYETEKKELQIERQNQVIARQNTQRGLLVAGVGVSVVFLILLWYMLRLRIRRNNALAEMNATKDKFFSIISHDLKNPAIMLRDALQILQKNGRSWDDDTLSEYYENLLKSAEGHVSLILNLLSWAQIQTGRIMYNPNVFIISSIVSDLAFLNKMAENKGVTLTFNLPQNALITCDSKMILTILLNLLTNAIKFTPKDGQVTLDISTTDAGYIFSVTDTGMGMSEEQIANIFSLSTTHSKNGTDGEQGSGLGLTICREFLEKHGSELHVESEEGGESRFWFEV